MEYTQEITLDLNSNTAPPIIYTKQGDADTRVLEIHLMEDGNEYQPPADAFAVFRMRKPDGTTIGAGVDDTTITSVNNNVITVRLSEQALAAAGRGLADILLYNGNQYLSTASFILVIQPAPVAVMRGVVSSNEYAYFQDCLDALATILPSAQEAANSALAASDSAWAAVDNINDNGILISTGSILVPGTSTSIIEKTSKNNFVFHAPTVKPHATASIQLIEDAEPLVEVSYSTCAPSAGEDSNLLINFDFDFTLPKNTLDVALSTTFTTEDSGKAGDAAAIGSFVTAATTNIPLTALASDYIIPLDHGGTGASSSESARANIGAQVMIQTSDFSIPSASWASNGNNGFYYTQNMPLNNVDLQGAVPHFIASPNDMPSWGAAADAGMGPPSAVAPAAGSTTWPLTFYCDSSPATSIGITVYWW